MAKRRPQGMQWSARAVPTHRRRMVDDLHESARVIEGRLETARQGGFTDPDITGRLLTQVEAERRWAQRAETADLYWVTGDMARLALDASQDVPDFHADQLPVPNGLLLLADPLPDILVPSSTHLIGGQQWQGRVPVWGLWWHPVDGGGATSVQVLTRRADLPRPMLYGTGQLQPVFGPRAPWGAPVDFAAMSGTLVDTDGASMPDEALGVLAFTAAVTVMMMTPTIAERRTLDARTGRSADQAPRALPSDLVTTIDLRPLRQVTADDEPGEGVRTYRHRWVVRGHWTHQPHGPGGSLRKLTYRAPYVKGPEGAPLLATEKVMVWRR